MTVDVAKRRVDEVEVDVLSSPPGPVGNRASSSRPSYAMPVREHAVEVADERLTAQLGDRFVEGQADDLGALAPGAKHLRIRELDDVVGPRKTATGNGACMKCR